MSFAAGREVSGGSIRSKPSPVACSGRRISAPLLARRAVVTFLFRRQLRQRHRNILRNYIEQQKKPR